MTSASPLSPPKHDEGQGKGLLPRAMADQLKAKLYATSEIHNSTQPVLKVRRRAVQDEVSGASTRREVTFISTFVYTQGSPQAKVLKLEPLVRMYM